MKLIQKMLCILIVIATVLCGCGQIKEVRKEIRFKGYENYYELHHVIPLNDGGKDEEKNLILFKIIEHCEAHFLYAIEHKSDNHAYHANLNSAWIILYGKRKKPPVDKEERLRAFLENPDYDFIKKLESHRKKIAEKKKLPYKKRDTLHTWVTNGSENKKVSNSELDSYFKKGWRKGYTKKH